MKYAEIGSMRTCTLLLLLLTILSLSCPQTAICNDFKLLCSNLLPLNYKNPEGEATGFAVEILEEIMKRAGRPVDGSQCVFEPWARAVKDLEIHPNTVLMSMAMTDQRRPLYKWVGPICKMKLGLIARKDRQIRIKRPDDLRRYTIGVIRDSGPEQILLNQFGVNRLMLYQLAHDTQQFGMLEVGRVDLITHTDLSSPLVLGSLGLNPADFEMVYVLKDIDLYYAFNRETDSRLIEQLQQELEKMKKKRQDGSSPYQDIIHKYLMKGSLGLSR